MPTRARSSSLEYQILVTAVLCLLAAGAGMVYSPSSARSLLGGGGDSSEFLVRYVGYGGPGPLLGLAFVLLVLVMIPGIGVEVNGARRWLGAGPLQFQPSEVMKLALVLHAAAVIAARPRLTAFLNPWADAGDTGFQAVQAQIAIGSGSLFGVGPGQSVQKIFYLPEAHTDFILAVIGEELGLAGIIVLLCLYGMIAYAGLRTAKAARGAYAKLLAAGLTSLILCQALLNTYTVLGLAPLTGVPLPFVSSGNTSLIVMLAAMGVILTI